MIFMYTSITKLKKYYVLHKTWFAIRCMPRHTPTVVSQVRLNLTHDFHLHGHLPRIKIQYICIEVSVATSALCQGFAS